MCIRFTENTTIRLAIQCVQSIESLHRIGFIHRDIKPQNYAIGLGDMQRVVYLLDYGLARQFVDRDGLLRPPRNQLGFRGTLRYASVNTHLNRDLGRQDDLLSLLYMLIELRMGELPWKGIADKDTVGEMKMTIVADVLLHGMPGEFHQILNEIEGLHFHDTPNYKYLCEQLETAKKRMKIRDGDRYDWEKREEGGIWHWLSGIFRKTKNDQKSLEKHRAKK